MKVNHYWCRSCGDVVDCEPTRECPVCGKRALDKLKDEDGE